MYYRPSTLRADNPVPCHPFAVSVARPINSQSAKTRRSRRRSEHAKLNIELFSCMIASYYILCLFHLPIRRLYVNVCVNSAQLSTVTPVIRFKSALHYTCGWLTGSVILTQKKPKKKIKNPTTCLKWSSELPIELR